MTVSRPVAFALALMLTGCAASAVPAPGDGIPMAQTSSSGSPAMGRALVRANCAGCHAVERTDESPLKAALPFRDMGAFYPASDLQEAFAEGIVTAHPAMPQFEFTPQQIADLIAYLDSISGPAAPPPPGQAGS
ncbi:MAG: cytochrome c [Pseudomonadota bacterium]